MKTVLKSLIATGLSLIALLFVAGKVSADSASPTSTATKTPTPTITQSPTSTPTGTLTPTPTGTLTVTPTPVVESYVQCTPGGAYGQGKTCHIVTKTQTVRPIVPAGIQENIIMALVVVFALSTAGYTYSKVRA